ncbi:MAG TPA: SMC family ATPase, partial [Gemmatimonadaceae bacterium]|nr:SMC family ATPase [Gemmatimonadaceae bacterium]
MRLRTLRLTNFRQHADTSVEFGSGITGIIGPNGSGKTTLFEAVAWALYGNDAARGRRDSIRFNRADAKAPVRVEMEFELAAHRYRIVRGLSSAELYLDGSEKPVATSITTVNEVLGRRLGMSRAEFFNTYFTGQKELSVMTALGPTERGQFLSRVLGYERLRAAQELARDRRRELNGEITGLRQVMPDAELVDRSVREAESRRTGAEQRAVSARDARDAAQRALETLAPKWEGAQRGRAHRQQAEADLRVAEGELQARTRDVDRANTAVNEADAAARELAELAAVLAPLPALVSEREALDVLARDEGRRQALTDAVRVATDDLTRLSDRRAAIADAPAREEEATVALESARAELRASTDALDVARTAWVRDKQEAETKRDALRSQYADFKEQRERIVGLGEEGTCPTCQRPLGTHYRSVLDMLDGQLDAVKVDGQYYKSRVEQLASQPAAVTELVEQNAQHADRAATLERRVAEVQAMAREMIEVTRGIARQEQRLAAHRAELATLPSGYDAARHA